MSFDPCISILAATKNLSEDQRIAAMGVKKMMSRKSKYKGLNCRAPNTTKSQGKGKDDLRVHWAPIFALGKVRVYVCDPQAAKRDESLPARLNESREIGKFIQDRGVEDRH